MENRKALVQEVLKRVTKRIISEKLKRRGYRTEGIKPRLDKKKSAIHFIEVKSGNANLSHDQEGIRAAIKKGRAF